MAEIEPLLTALANASGAALTAEVRKAFGEVLALAAQQEREACEQACLALANRATSANEAAAARSLAEAIKARGKPITRWRVQLPTPGQANPKPVPPPQASPVAWLEAAAAPAETLQGRFIFPCARCARPVTWTLKGFQAVPPDGQELHFEVACANCQLQARAVITGEPAPT